METQRQTEHSGGKVFLTMLSRLLNTALDFEATLNGVGELSVPFLADWCAVDVAVKDGEHRRIGQFGVPAGLETKNNTGFEQAISDVLRTGDTAIAADGKRWIVVPLMARGEILGAMTFARVVRSYSEVDVELAEELARQTGVAAHSALLVQKLKRASDARSELIAVVSHELRNMLTTFRLNLHFLQREACASDATMGAAIGNVMEGAIDRMERITGDLLDSEKIEIGQLALVSDSCGVAELFEEVERLYRPLATREGVELSVEVSDGNMCLICDRQRILQVFSNLLSNAIKFTPIGGRVQVTAKAADEGMIRFEVQDTGRGIPEERLERVFDRYWQVRENAIRGSGLGLYISKGIVLAHGGRIWVESAPGKGSVFRFELPLTPIRQA